MKKILSMLAIMAMVIMGMLIGAGSATAKSHGHSKDHGNSAKHDKPAHEHHEKRAHKDYVCKYVGKPGVNERLQSGNNPTWVDSHATAGTWFNDEHGRSYVLIENTVRVNPEPSINDCPSV